MLSPSDDPVSRLWNHITGQPRAWERAPLPPKHFQGMLLSEFTWEQFAVTVAGVPTSLGYRPVIKTSSSVLFVSSDSLT